jgi:hypothetical protein
MLAALVVALIIIAFFSWPAITWTKKYKTLHIWDYVYPFVGIPLWIILLLLDMGQTASLSNFVVENFWITVVSIITPWLVMFLYRSKTKMTHRIAKILTWLPVVFTLALRILINTLPE